MSSRQLDDARDEAHEIWLAHELGIAVEDLEELQYFEEPKETNDGAPIGWLVSFNGEVPERLRQQMGLEGNFKILPLPDDGPDGPEDE